MSDMIAMLHCSHQCIRHSQHLFGLFHPALFHQLADVSGTDFDAVHFDLLYGLDAKARCGAILSRSSAFPAPFLPKDRSSPAATNRVFICLARISVAKHSGSVAAVSFVRGNSIRVSIPRRSNRRLFFLSGSQFFTVRQAEQHCRCRVKGEHARRQPVFFSAKNLFQKSPVARWTPSNLPMATAVSFSR